MKYTLVHAICAHKVYYPILESVYCSTNHRIAKRFYWIHIILRMETTGETSSNILACIDHGFPLRYLINLVFLIVKMVPAAEYSSNYKYMKKNTIKLQWPREKYFKSLRPNISVGYVTLYNKIYIEYKEEI